MRNPIRKLRIQLLVASALVIAFTLCSSQCEAQEIGLGHGQNGEVMENARGDSAASLASGVRLVLRDGWQVQTSSGQPDGESIAKAGFAATGWYPTAIPASVSGVLAQVGVYPDPFFSTNLRNWPGTGRGRRGGAANPGAPVRPKNSAETRWRIEPQGLLKDSPPCDDSTPIPPDLCRRLDEPTPTDGHRIPSGRESHSPGATRWQTQALHRRPANPAGSQSQARRSAPPWEIGHTGHSRYPAPLVSCPDCQKVDLCQD